jgi:hypothetical protein
MYLPFIKRMELVVVEIKTRTTVENIKQAEGRYHEWSFVVCKATDDDLIFNNTIPHTSEKSNASTRLLY